MSTSAPRLTTQQLVDNLDVAKFHAAHGSPGVSPVAVLRAKGFGPAQIESVLWDFRVGGDTTYTSTLPPGASVQRGADSKKDAAA